MLRHHSPKYVEAFNAELFSKLSSLAEQQNDEENDWFESFIFETALPILTENTKKRNHKVFLSKWYVRHSIFFLKYSSLTSYCFNTKIQKQYDQVIFNRYLSHICSAVKHSLSYFYSFLSHNCWLLRSLWSWICSTLKERISFL